MDAVTMQVVLNATGQIMREMRIKMMRTGFSSIVRESSDAYFGICDVTGEVVSSVEAGAVAAGVIRSQTRAVLARYGDRFAPGDAYILNHPYEDGQSHTCDVVVVSPIFREGRHVAFVSNYAHKPDLGGKVPGTQAGDATDILQEGLLIPPVPLARGGRIDETVRAFIRANSRTPDVTWGDVQAQVFTNQYGAERLAELMERFGTETVLEAWNQWADIGEQEAARRIRAIPDGTYGPAVEYLDDDGVDRGVHLRIEASLTVAGDRLRFRFDSSPQARGPVNLRPCILESVTDFLVQCAIAPDLAGCPGVRRCIDVLLPPPGHLLNPRFPAAVNMYSTVRARVGSPIVRVLAEALPERVPAPGSGANHSVSVNGIDPRTGRWFSYYEILWGGHGGRPGKDGVAHLCDGMEVRNTPVEAIETEFPVRVRRFALVPDSAGPGEYRGGLGAVREWEVLADEIGFNLRSDHFEFPSPGARRGGAGSPSAAQLQGAGGEAEPLHSKTSGLRLRRGDRVTLRLAGGGGWGDPLARDPEQVRQDVLDGYISQEAARDGYGVVLDPGTLTLDPDETARVRHGQGR